MVKHQVQVRFTLSMQEEQAEKLISFYLSMFVSVYKIGDIFVFIYLFIFVTCLDLFLDQFGFGSRKTSD